MCWIGGRKGRSGGNPGSVRRVDGDLPSGIEYGGVAGAGSRPKNLTAVLMGSSGKSGPPIAPWKSPLAGMPDPLSASIPSASRLGGGRDRSQPQGVSAQLPSWIKVDAHLSYVSKSSRKVKEVIVEMVNHAKCEVEITFAENSNVWKVLPFSMVTSDSSPLIGPWKDASVAEAKREVLPVAQDPELDKDEMPRRPEEPTGSRGPVQPAEGTGRRSKSRSRSPKLAADPT
mmetsp:Transcript_20184/g.55906  ORF Transcript_20184/g.55906 Transcript_20184/m.55906 type:complete len:229 (-) Transcript_20184:126-812(-)